MIGEGNGELTRSTNVFGVFLVYLAWRLQSQDHPNPRLKHKLVFQLIFTSVVLLVSISRSLSFGVLVLSFTFQTHSLVCLLSVSVFLSKSRRRSDYSHSRNTRSLRATLLLRSRHGHPLRKLTIEGPSSLVYMSYALCGLNLGNQSQTSHRFSSVASSFTVKLLSPLTNTTLGILFRSGRLLWIPWTGGILLLLEAISVIQGGCNG